MKTFNATITTEFATYYIDLKISRFGMNSNPYCVSAPDCAVYLTSVQDCLNWIEFYDGALKLRAEAEAVWQLQHA